MKRDTDHHADEMQYEEAVWTARGYPQDEGQGVTGDYQRGTRWVAPGEGSTWRELCCAFGDCGITDREYTAALRARYSYRWFSCGLEVCTNLLLTGAPLTATDRERWESGKVE